MRDRLISLAAIVMSSPKVNELTGYDRKWLTQKAVQFAACVVNLDYAEIAAMMFGARYWNRLASLDEAAIQECADECYKQIQSIVEEVDLLVGVHSVLSQNPWADQVQVNQGNVEQSQQAGELKQDSLDVSESSSPDVKPESENAGGVPDSVFDVPDAVKSRPISDLSVHSKYLAQLEAKGCKTIGDIMSLDAQSPISKLPEIGEATRTRIFNKIKALALETR